MTTRVTINTRHPDLGDPEAEAIFQQKFGHLSAPKKSSVSLSEREQAARDLAEAIRLATEKVAEARVEAVMAAQRLREAQEAQREAIEKMLLFALTPTESEPK